VTIGLAVGLAAGAVSRSKRLPSSSDGMRSPAFAASAHLLMLRGAMRSAVFVASATLPTLRGARATSTPSGLLPFLRAGLQRSIAPKLLEILCSPAVFWCFAAAGLPATAPAVPSAPLQRVRPNFGTVGAMIHLNLIWLVHGGFWAKKKVSQDATIFCFGENWRRYFLDRYQLLRTST
jgi:hypothetical protein